MSSFEAFIVYRRQLREKQADAVSLRWGRTRQTAVVKDRRLWHLTRASEAPCTSECGVLLTELGPVGMRRPLKMCNNCRKWSSAFVDLWQEG